MNIFGLEINIKPKSKIIQEESVIPEPNSSFGQSYGQYYPVVSRKWDGEKTLGELGLVTRNDIDYDRLRLRALDAYIKTDIVKIIAKKRFDWVVGSGLKLQVEPNKIVLQSEGISNDWANFQKIVEARFMVYSNSVNCDFSKQKNLHQLAYDFYKSKYLSGDCLCIIRFGNTGPNAQFISAEHVQTPTMDTALLDEVKARGNYIERGIEFNNEGEHVAYFVATKKNGTINFKFERIPAKGEKTGRKLAWLIYGEQISPDHKRGVPDISQILEKVNKLDRYTEASVGKAEQAAKILYTVVHDNNSTGEDIMSGIVNKKLKLAGTEQDSFVLADGLALRVEETTSNMTINMPIGSKLESFGTEIETNFDQFYKSNFNIISASSGVPPEVALQMYSSNYSASRAAINGWGYVVDIDRKDFENSFYKPFYKLWLEFEILRNKIQAPGFVEALVSGDFMVTESYTQCRFIGKNMPHIDPLKEIKAIRAMLGDDDQTPLISREQATESLNSGQWDENYMKNEEEKKIITIIEPPKEIINNGKK